MPASPTSELDALETLPLAECEARHARVRKLLARLQPEAHGLLLSDKVHIYYLTGCLGTGLFWLPREGEPVLLLRKGVERARVESPLSHILPFVSYREISVKSPFEQERMRTCGEIHAEVYDLVLPELFEAGMSEQELACVYISEVMARGCDGMCRMRSHGEEMFFGYASTGTSGLYPTPYNGPLGCRGLHPAVPFLGSRDRVWEKNQCLSLDMGCQKYGYRCQKYGYHTDRTQVYWSGHLSTIPAKLASAQKICRDILCSTLELMRPGVTPQELWSNALQMAKKNNVRESFMGLGRDQVPFLGHGIGLALDEWPALARSFNEPLAEGMAIALEPKISVPGMGMVGIEHTYLVQADGPEPLTGTQMDIICLE